MGSNDRIHDYIDGARPRGELGVEERDRLAALEAAIDGVASPLRAAPAPDLSAAVMARIAETRAAAAPTPAARAGAAVRRALEWLWTPRLVTVRLRPAHALGALGVVPILVLLSQAAVSLRPRADAYAAAEASAAPRVYVQFHLDARGATRVALAGSFTDWQPAYELRETAPGSWSVVVPLRPGIHDYAFVVDGEEWVADPHALRLDDGFGGVNSRIALPPPSAEGVRS